MITCICKSGAFVAFPQQDVSDQTVWINLPQNSKQSEVTWRLRPFADDAAISNTKATLKSKSCRASRNALAPLTHRGKASMLQVHEKRTSSSPAMIERRYRCTRKGSRRSGAIIFCGFAAEAIFLSSRKSHALKTHGRGGESSTTVCAISGAHKFRPSGQPGPRSMGKRRTSTA